MIQKARFPGAKRRVNLSKQDSRTSHPNIFAQKVLLNKGDPIRNWKKTDRRNSQFPVPKSQFFWSEREA